MNGQYRHSTASTATRFGGTPDCKESVLQYHRPPKGGAWRYYWTGLTPSVPSAPLPPKGWRYCTPRVRPFHGDPLDGDAPMTAADLPQPLAEESLPEVRGSGLVP